MKVYIIAKEPFPNGMAATNRIKCYAKAIISQGVDCEVLVYCRTELAVSAKNTEAIGTHEGIPFRYIGGTTLRKNIELLNKFNTICDRISLLEFLKKNISNEDIIIGYGNQDLVFFNYLIHIIHLCKAKYIRELCELPLGTGKETSSVLRKRALLFKYQFPICDGFIAISDALVNIAESHKSLEAKIVKVPILVDYEEYELPDKSRFSYMPYIFHSGTLTEQKDGFLGMVEAFGLAHKELGDNIKFISTGSIEKVSDKEKLIQLIEKFGIKDQIEFTGYLSEENLKEYLAGASLTIINKYDTQQNRYCFSTKLGEYMAAGKPVIITDVGEAKNWLTNEENALIVETGNVKALSDAIVDLFTDENKRLKIGNAGKTVCKNCFSYQSQSKNLVEFLRRI